MRDLLEDVRHGTRRLLRSPAFTLAAVLTLSLGIASGIVAALAVTRLMDALLFDVTSANPMTYAAVTAFLLASAGLASRLPARRAARLDPVAALRSELA